VTIGLFETPYFVISGANSVLALFPDSASIVATIAVGQSPRYIARDRFNERMFITNFTDNTVSVVDGVTNKPVTTVKVGNGPSSIAANDTTSRVYVANDSSISVIEDLSPQTPIPERAAQVSKAQAQVRWQDSCPLCKYEIERTTALRGLSGFTQIGTVGPHKQVFHDRDVQPGTTYYYRIRAFHTAADGAVYYSGYSDTITAVIPRQPRGH
jgi:YVTN family beta-propeller protein